MGNSNWKDKLEDLAASQGGLFTAAQAQAIGAQRNQVARLAKRGVVESIDYGVYQFASACEADNVGTKAAWLSLYPKETAYERMRRQPLDAVVRGRTAAFLHGLGDFYPMPFCFAVSKRRQTRRENIRCTEEAVDPCDVVLVDSLPTMTIERTIADLVREGEDPTLLGRVIEDAARAGHDFDVERLAVLLAPLAEKHGYGDGASFARALLSENARDAQRERFSRMIDAFRASKATRISPDLLNLTVLYGEGLEEKNTVYPRTSRSDD